MFVSPRKVQVTWRDYNRRVVPTVINPLTLPKVVNVGFGEFGFIQAILGFIKSYQAKKKAAEARRAARAQAAAMIAEMEKEVREWEEYLEKKWERETTTREESKKMEEARAQYLPPPIKAWGQMSIAERGGTLIESSK